MKKYIALLRGINVGGKNTVAMSRLKIAFEEARLSNVSTYINSGNVFFSSDDPDTIALQQICHQAILNAFSLDIPVAVISAEALAHAMNHAPAWWDGDQEAKHNAIFVIAPATAEGITREVGQAKPEYEQVAYCEPIIFWTAQLNTFSRSRWSKVVSTSAYGSITIRNANTTKKLLQLSKPD